MGWRYLVGVLVVVCAACSPRPEPVIESIDVASALGGAVDEGFLRAVAPREFAFPADHAAHPGYRNEWWYLTGNLDAADGRRFGFQLTFFRIQLLPRMPERESAWATDTVWMAHFAVSDVARERHHAFERYARGAAGIAGATAAPTAVWLEDWRLRIPSETEIEWRLEAVEQGVGLRLQLAPHGAVVLQGDRGLSQKSAEPGNASFYYSIPRLRARGEIAIDGQRHAVTGLAWLDREWSTSALGPDQAGWDWFALQFDDGTDLMFYQLRRRDGGVDSHSKGSVSNGASTLSLAADDVIVRVTEHWTSPSGVRYPGAWQLHLPRIERTLTVRPVFNAQEMDVSVRYWEGAVDVWDELGAAIGRGYVELAGYRSDDPRSVPATPRR